MDICTRLHAAKDDEASGILEYAKLKNLLTSEQHIDTIESIIGDEYEHLLEILAIIKDLKCETIPNETITGKMSEIETVIEQSERAVRSKAIAKEAKK